MEPNQGEAIEFERGLRDETGAPLVEQASFRRGTPAGILIVFPGRQYGPGAPLLRGPIEALTGESWDVLVASYREDAASGQGDPILGRARQALDRILPARGYRRIALLGKSMGTPYVAALCADEAGLGRARAAYLTPLIGNPVFERNFLRTQQPSYLAIGTADPFYTVEALERLKTGRDLQLTVVDGADHGLNVPGNPQASGRAVAHVVGEVVAFFIA